MKWSPPILVQVATLAFATLVLAFSLCLAIALLTPVPVPVRMTVNEVASALRDGNNDTLPAKVRSFPPDGPRVPEVEAALALRLRTSPGRIRVRWLNSDGAGKANATGKSVILVGDRALLVDSDAKGFRMRYGADVRLGSDVPMPAFEAGLRQADGRWRYVTPADRHLAAWRLRLLLAFGVALALSAVPVWFAARRLSRPVRALADAAMRSDLDSEAPFHVEGPAEIRAVAVAMNTMHRHLADQANERFQAFLAIAHDLRTPLTGLRIRAELIPAGDRERVIGDLDRMAAMIDNILDYARLDQRSPQRYAVDLSVFIATIAEDRRLIGQKVDIAPALDQVRAPADVSLLHRAIDNLIDNALRFAGSACLSLEIRAGQVDIHIDDHGPGIPAGDVGRIVAPFTRLEPSRSRATGGVGLGLAITNRIATAHGGHLTLSSRKPHGLRATITLPTCLPGDTRLSANGHRQAQ